MKALGIKPGPNLGQQLKDMEHQNLGVKTAYEDKYPRDSAYSDLGVDNAKNYQEFKKQD